MRIFISSVQKEFEAERRALAEYISSDPLLGKFFEPFLFEKDVPASDYEPDAIYLDEVNRCDIYLGLFGDDYGWENEDGLSPTHLEFNEATQQRKFRLIFIKGDDDKNKHRKMKQLIATAGNQLVRRRFQSSEELHASVYASLISYLESTGKLTHAPWDARSPHKASLDDIDPALLTRFVRRARKARNFPLPVEAEMDEVLTHLNLLDGRKPTQAALLLFGKRPQQFALSSEVKCAHFHGVEIAKPIPSYQVYKGTAFELVDQAIDFVMSKINVSTGTREKGVQAPVKYEIPRDVIAEAIVNAVAHRDYNSNGSVQVMLFSDRLEIWNPGTLPSALTLDLLRQPHSSIPRNPLLAESLYLNKYIERMGTGTRDMIAQCKASGIPEPQFSLTDCFVVTLFRPKQDTAKHQPGTNLGLGGDQVGTKLGLSEDQVAIVRKCLVPCKIPDLMEVVGRANRTKFRNQVLAPLLKAGLVEMTIPDKPTSSLQKYRTTSKGKAILSKS